MADKTPPTDVEPEIIETHGSLSRLDRAEIDMQIATAKRFPRSLVKFKRDALEMATLDEETAGSMFYSLPRDGKMIEGPSVRLAEVCGSAWGNVRYGARPVSEDERYVTAQGVCYDLERNVYASIEVRRRITNKAGKRYGDDMIGTTAGAAAKIALREAVFLVIPRAFIKDVYEQAKAVSLGKALTMEQRRSRALEWFAKVGVKMEQILKLLRRKGIEEITVDDLIVLQGVRTAIQDGETTVEQIVRDIEHQATEVRPDSLTAESIAKGSATGEDNAEVPSRKPSTTEKKRAEPAPSPSSALVTPAVPTSLADF